MCEKRKGKCWEEGGLYSRVSCGVSCGGRRVRSGDRSLKEASAGRSSGSDALSEVRRNQHG